MKRVDVSAAVNAPLRAGADSDDSDGDGVGGDGAGDGGGDTPTRQTAPALVRRRRRQSALSRASLTPVLRVTVGVERTRAPVDPRTLPTPMLEHLGCVLVPPTTDMLLAPDPLPAEWLDIATGLGETRNGGSGPSAFESQLRQRKLSKAKKLAQLDAAAAAARAAAAAAAASELPQSLAEAVPGQAYVWCVCVHVKSCRHLRRRAVGMYNTAQWRIGYGFAGAHFSARALRKKKTGAAGAAPDGGDAGTEVEFDSVHKHLFRCTRAGLEALLLDEPIVLFELDDATDQGGCAYCAPVALASLKDDMIVDTTVVLADQKSGVPLDYEFYPPYFTVEVTLYPVSLGSTDLAARSVARELRFGGEEAHGGGPVEVVRVLGDDRRSLVGE